MGNGSVLALALGASPVVKGVLVILIFFSLLCWTVIIQKARRFRAARRADEEFEEEMKGASGIEELYYKAKALPDSPMGSVFLEAYPEISRLSELGMGGAPALQALQRALERGRHSAMERLLAKVPLLATIGNASPFIGLFGTVWGIMGSFHSIGLKGSASLATVAPGISEALIATAAGLFAAIPAVVAYNAFMAGAEAARTRLEAFELTLLNQILFEAFSKGASKGKARRA